MPSLTVARTRTHPRPGLPVRVLLAAIAIGVAGVGVADARPQQEPPPAAQQPATPPVEVQTPDSVLAPPRFMSGKLVTLSEAAGTVIYWGEGAVVDGHLAHSALLGGATARVERDGLVEGDLLIFGSTVRIDGEILHDVYVWAADLVLGPTARIHGNLVTFSGGVRIEGTVRGQVKGGGGHTTISGHVGSLDMEAGSLTIASGATVEGDIDYRSNEDAEIADDATVGGEVRREATGSNRSFFDRLFGKNERPDEEESSGFSTASLLWRLWRYLSVLVIGIAALLIGGAGARAPVRELRESPASGVGFGFVVCVVTPVSCLVAVALLVTAPLGILGMLLFLIAVFLGWLVSGQFVGDLILRRMFRRSEPSEYLTLALGLLVLGLVTQIPYVGFLVRIGAWVMGVGGIYLALRAAGFPWTSPTASAAPAGS